MHLSIYLSIYVFIHKYVYLMSIYVYVYMVMIHTDRLKAEKRVSSLGLSFDCKGQFFRGRSYGFERADSWMPKCFYVCILRGRISQIPEWRRDPLKVNPNNGIYMYI